LAKLLIRTGIARFLPAVRRLTDGAGPFLHYYNDRVLGAPFAELRDAAPFRELSGPDAIDLAAASPRFDLVPSATTKLPVDRRGLPPPWGLPELREAVAAKLQADQRLTRNPANEVFITAGATGAWQLAADTLVNRGDRVVLFDPTSPLFALTLRHRGARLRWISTWLEGGRTRFRLEPLVKALTGARLIVINAPTNPTGGVLAAEDLEQIAWWANRRDVLIYSDDVFERYRYEGEALSIGTLASTRDRTLTAGSLSQGYGLASARVGWLSGHRHLIRPCALSAFMHTPFVSTLCQQLAVTALRQGAEVFQPMRSEFESRRRYAYERLQAMGLKPAWPAGAYFLWIPVGDLGLTGREFAARMVQAKKVLVVPGDLFGPSGPTHIRLSYAVEDGRLREGLTRLADFVRELRGMPVSGSRGAA
jgi:aspartate/methionine/tyrosine aminotransferase